MVDITIVNGVYKPTYNWGAPSCINANMNGILQWEIRGNICLYNISSISNIYHLYNSIYIPLYNSKIRDHNTVGKAKISYITIILLYYYCNSNIQLLPTIY